MATAQFLAELQAEVRCPMCLDYLSDPVTTQCGHNFCHSCLCQCWEGLQELFPCPICFYQCLGQLKINTQLRQLVSIVQQLPALHSDRKPRCGKHGEALDLFCKEDLELLCPQCRAASDHHHHHHDLMPINEAAAWHRRKLKDHIERLREQVQEAEVEKEFQLLKSTNIRLKMRDWKEELKSEFEEFKRLLEKEQDIMQARLHFEEKAIKEKLKENISCLSAYLATIRNVLTDIRDKCSQTDAELLRTARSSISRYEGIQVPEVFSYELRQESCRLPPHYFSLQRMISKFQVDMKIDLESVPPDVVISDEGKRMMLGERTNASPHRPPDYVIVQGQGTFRSGRHFWQVEVRGTGVWGLGVCSESVRGSASLDDGSSSSCWRIQQAIDELGAEISRVGVFLDWELGEISFYDLNSRSCLCVFTKKFTEDLVAFFYMAYSSKSLSITIVK